MSFLVVLAQAQDVQRFTFTDTGEALINPKMGWTMHFYSNHPENYGSQLEPSDSLDWFEGCSTVYLRIPWAYLDAYDGQTGLLQALTDALSETSDSRM
ncbi:MAG: hypothetical protein IKS45_03155, partial [Thermoguttaceae bacterium]|nr:hypothetical protein [Thermoguttaceae bacterium]